MNHIEALTIEFDKYKEAIKNADINICNKTRGLKSVLRNKEMLDNEYRLSFDKIFKRLKRYAKDKSINLEYEQILEITLKFYLKQLSIQKAELNKQVEKKRTYKRKELYQTMFIRCYQNKKKDTSKESIYRTIANTYNIKPSTVRRYCKSIKI